MEMDRVAGSVTSPCAPSPSEAMSYGEKQSTKHAAQDSLIPNDETDDGAQ